MADTSNSNENAQREQFNQKLREQVPQQYRNEPGVEDAIKSGYDTMKKAGVSAAQANYDKTLDALVKGGTYKTREDAEKALPPSMFGLAPEQPQTHAAPVAQRPAAPANQPAPEMIPEQLAPNGQREDRYGFMELKQAMQTQPGMMKSVEQMMDTDHNHSITKKEVLDFVRTRTDEIGYNPSTNTSLNAAVIQTDIQYLVETLKAAGVKGFDTSHLEAPTMGDVQAIMPKQGQPDKGHGGR